jgi:hypothetical protein
MERERERKQTGVSVLLRASSVCGVLEEEVHQADKFIKI